MTMQEYYKLVADRWEKIEKDNLEAQRCTVSTSGSACSVSWSMRIEGQESIRFGGCFLYVNRLLNILSRY